MLENKLFEALLDVIPFSAYAVDIETYEVIYANKICRENMYAPQEDFCWEKIYGQKEICPWCTIHKLQNARKVDNKSKLNHEFFDEMDDKWLTAYDELMSWPDGRKVKYSILVDTTGAKESQGELIRQHAKLAVKSKQISVTNKKLQIAKLNLQKTVRELEESKTELQLLASTDPLTGLYNRRHFSDISKSIFAIARRNYADLSVLIMDIDKFKDVNDAYGHDVGDVAINVVSSVLQKNSRSSDVICRFGGEEFVVLLPETSEEGAFTIAEKIRTSLAETEINLPEIAETHTQSIRCTISIGVSTIDPKADENVEAAISRADKALYQAKHQGRNQTCCYSES